MRHLDEGTIHTWLDGALPPDESQRAEAHVAACETCAAAVAEARGLIAASSRILGTLDDVPAGVIPGRVPDADALAALRARRAAERPARRWWMDRRFAAAAAITFIAATATLVARQGGAPMTDAALDTSERTSVAAPTPPAPAPSPSPTPASTSAPAPAPTTADAAAGGAGARPEARNEARTAAGRSAAVDSSLAPRRALSKEAGAGTAPREAALEPLAQAEATRQVAPPSPVPARQDAAVQQGATASQQGAAAQQQGAVQAQVTQRAGVTTPVLPAAPPPAAALGVEASRFAARPDPQRLGQDSAAIALRARVALRGFTAMSARLEGDAALADRAPAAPEGDFVPVCYQLAPATPTTMRQALIPERVLLDSAVAAVEFGSIWFRARDLASAPPTVELWWRPQPDALVDLRVRLTRPGTAAAAARPTELRVLASLPRAAASDPAVGPPRAPWHALPISCPR